QKGRGDPAPGPPEGSRTPQRPVGGRDEPAPEPSPGRDGRDPGFVRFRQGANQGGGGERRLPTGPAGRGRGRTSRMINQELLNLLREDILRCPMDPSRTRLSLEEDHLVCQRCRLRFKIKDGIPDFLVEEAELPPDCPSLDQLPCQREGKP